jgi:hypothetical protein
MKKWLLRHQTKNPEPENPAADLRRVKTTITQKVVETLNFYQLPGNLTPG